MNQSEELHLAADLIDALRKAEHVAVLTGAGVSAESGIPTFRVSSDLQEAGFKTGIAFTGSRRPQHAENMRGLPGLWEQFRAEDLATPEAFARDPALVWGWYEWRRAAVLRAQPNPAHLAIARMAGLVPRLTLVTQNVDDLHERAGSRDVLHLHGEIARPYCGKCRKAHALADVVPDMPEGGRRLEPPACLACGGRIRPGVVWFGESLPQAPWRAAVEAVKQCDVFLCVGTSAVVQPAASLIGLARESGAVTVQVNPNQTEADSVVSYSLRGKAEEVLPELVRSVWAA